ATGARRGSSVHLTPDNSHRGLQGSDGSTREDIDLDEHTLSAAVVFQDENTALNLYIPKSRHNEPIAASECILPGDRVDRYDTSAAGCIWYGQAEERDSYVKATVERAAASVVGGTTDRRSSKIEN